MWLQTDAFRAVVAAAPLVAIDLLLRDSEGRVLLGLRRNRPAQGWWFVPGGRIRKGETLDEAFARIAREELGLTLRREEARLLGVHEHFYEDSVFAPAGLGPTTHYVVLVHGYDWPGGELPLASASGQHEELRWWPEEAMATNPRVHRHTRSYARLLTAALWPTMKQGESTT